MIFMWLSFAAAFAVSALFAPGIIGMLRRRQIGQTISEDGPESHRSKAGTPTMGGLIILAGVLGGVSAALWAGLLSPGLLYLPGALLLMAAYALVGLLDDYLTIHPAKGVRGIASKPKAAIQVLIAVTFVAWLATQGGFLPVLSFAGRPLIGGTVYWIFAVILIVGMANFINITDGLDGLAAGLTCIACIGMMTAGFDELRGPGLDALLWAIAGACLGFLWFNANPAKVFMGDTGSLAIGAGLPAIAIATHHEILLIVAGLVFVLDGLSSMVQWAVFKFTRITTGTGRRVFKKSPIHHHFELCGWPEQTIVVRFWIVGVLAAVAGFVGAVGRLW